MDRSCTGRDVYSSMAGDIHLCRVAMVRLAWVRVEVLVCGRAALGVVSGVRHFDLRDPAQWFSFAGKLVSSRQDCSEDDICKQTSGRGKCVQISAPDRLGHRHFLWPDLWTFVFCRL